MTFTVTYRAKDGAKAEEEIEAASRAECFARCRARGIAPLGVREGRAKRAGGPGGGAGPSPARKPFAVRFCLFVAIAALAAIAWWWLARDGARRRGYALPTALR